jgi:hypothetical protein
MKTLQVIIVLIGFMFSFNNQIFAIECDATKFFQNVKDLVATQWADEKLRKEVARYSVCEGPVKIQYKILKVVAKKLFDLENYEKTSGSKVSKKTKSGGKTEKLSKIKSCQNYLFSIGQMTSRKNKDRWIAADLKKWFKSIERPDLEKQCPQDVKYIKALKELEGSYLMAGIVKAFENNDYETIKYVIKRFDKGIAENKNFADHMKNLFRMYKERALNSGLLAKDDNQKTKIIDTNEKDKMRLVVQTAKLKYGVSQINTTENGEFLISGHGDGQIILWDVSNREVIRVFNEKHKGPVKNLCINDSNLQIISSDNREIYVWNMINGKKINTYRFGGLGGTA